MLKIRERGCIRHVSKRAYNQKWKDKGYKIVEDLDSEEDGQLEDKTYDELYEIAQDINLKGRSTMDRDELISEIEKVR